MKPPQELDVGKKQNVTYCIPMWLRDQQIEHSTRRIPGRLVPEGAKDGPIAVVCYGPSLNETWEKVKDFKYVLTCSGAHRFLVDRGICPSYHIEVDPREHKVSLMGPPQKETQYLMAATCHPKMWDHLEGHNIKLWHVYDPSDGARLCPPGEWGICGGSNAGLRALTIAAFLGFRDIHVFGMDGCDGTVDAPSKTGKHAGPHPNQPKDHAIVDYGGVKYRTTPGMLEGARETWHELDQMPAVKVTFYGEGLIQHMARDYTPKPQENGQITNVIAFSTPELISTAYRELNRKLHETNMFYGVGGGKHAGTVKKLKEAIKAESILDYGCGRGMLAKELPFPIWEYDPAIPGKDRLPRPAELSICTDVLEHIEPDKLNYVLDHLRTLTLKVGFFVIHTGPSKKTLADGRNAHLIQKDQKWWEKQLKKHFKIGKMQVVGPEIFVVVSPKAGKTKVKIVKADEHERRDDQGTVGGSKESGQAREAS